MSPFDRAGRPLRTIEVYADTRGHNTCRGCGAMITWAENVRTHKRLPFDGELVALQTRHDEAHRLIETVDLATCHFSTCPNADDFRRPR